MSNTIDTATNTAVNTGKETAANTTVQAQHTPLWAATCMLLCCGVLLGTGCAIPAKLADKQPTVYQAEIPEKWATPHMAHWNRAQHPQHTTYDAQAPAQQWPDDWWLVFNDPQLNALIATAQMRNPDLLQAALRIHQAQLQADSAQRLRSPSSNASLSASASRSLAQSGSPISRSFGASLGVSYQVDLLGKLRDGVAIAEWQKTATVEDLRAVQLTQITQIAQTYWQLQRTHAQIQLVQRAIDNAKETLRLASVRHRAGAAARMDVVSVENALLSIQQQLTDLHDSLRQHHHNLAVLLGQTPQNLPPLQILPALQPQHQPVPPYVERSDGTAVPTTAIATALPPLPPLPQHLPASLLARRPDVAAAQWRLRATLAGVKIARADFYPSLNLNASLGTGGNVVRDILENPSAALSAALNLPFLDQAANRIAHKQAKIRYQQALLQFRQTLYGAFRDVENARSTRLNLHSKHRQLQRQLAQTSTLERMHKVRYLAGATNMEPWLQAQQNSRNAAQNLLDNRFAQYRNAITLYAALGGSTRIPNTKVPALAEQE